MPQLPDVAIVLTVHHEGRGLVPTVRALERSIAAAPNLAVEVIIVRDRADEATRDALDMLVQTGGFEHAASVVTVDVDNGDLSASRNDGIAAATAGYVGVLDADNLPSANWIADAHQLLASQAEPSVVHPELIVTFGAKREVWPLIGTDDARFRAHWLSWFNTWDAFAMADRRVFERIPYRPSAPGGGFGPEDWAWNCDTVGAGVAHLIVSGTTLFYRATDHGLAAAHHASLIPQNNLLRDKALASSALTVLGIPDSLPSRRPRAVRFVARVVRRLMRPIRVRLAAQRADHHAPPPRALRVRKDEWAALHRLQPAIPSPSDDVLRAYGQWGTAWSETFLPEQRAYWAGVAALPSRIDVLVIAPWLRTGGADLLTRQYIDSVRRSRPDAVIALVTTEPEPSTRLDGLPDVVVFDLGAFRLLPQFGVRVLGTLIAQVRPGTVHVVNSTLGFDVLDRYGRALSMESNLFASTFVIDALPDGTEWSFLHHRGRDFYEPVTAVLTDNDRLVRYMVENEGAPADAFVVHHAVVDEEFTSKRPRRAGESAPLRIAWAGRFDRQKRLDRLADIAESLRDRPVEVHLYGDVVIGDDPTLDATLDRLERAGVVRHPAYTAGFGEVVADGADALLLTSDVEGVPNTVLEAMSSGVTVIAPDVGDITRIIGPETGYLVHDRGDTAGYIAAIDAVIADPETALARTASARALVASEYSADALDRTLESLPGYLPRKTGGRGVAHRWFTDHDTAELLRSGRPLTLVYTGSNGHSNFGDILQNKNILHYWSQREDRTPVLFLPAFAGENVERIAALRKWFRCPNIVFFSPTRVSSPPGLDITSPTETGAPVHVVGGGYLNARWGREHFSAIDAIATAFGASQVFFTGLQIDEGALQGFTALAEHHRVPFVGLRDDASFRLVDRHPTAPAVDTFDDLTEVLEDWSRGAQATDPARHDGPRVAIHMNTSDYAGGAQALQVWKDALTRVAAMNPSEVILLSAYSDARPEVRDTLGSVAALAEDFPFAAVTLLDTARAALDSTPGTGLPQELAALRGVDFGLSSSYHTALMMSFLGIPAYLMGANAYFSQKAELFRLPELQTFLNAPDSYRLDLDAHRARRREWLDRLDRMTFED